MPSRLKVALLDFDGTLVTKDMLDVLCEARGKGAESRAINEAFHRGEVQGVSGLIQRINFLSGMTLDEVTLALSNNYYLMPGALELMAYFKKNGIVTILASGNIVPVLETYKEVLGLDHVVGTHPQMEGDMIAGIDESAFSSKNFKIDGVQQILDKLEVAQAKIVAIGDSPSDKGLFGLSGYSVAINPKGDIADGADAVVYDDLRQVIELLEKY